MKNPFSPEAPPDVRVVVETLAISAFILALIVVFILIVVLVPTSLILSAIAVMAILYFISQLYEPIAAVVKYIFSK